MIGYYIFRCNMQVYAQIIPTYYTAVIILFYWNIPVINLMFEIDQWVHYVSRLQNIKSVQ